MNHNCAIQTGNFFGTGVELRSRISREWENKGTQAVLLLELPPKGQLASVVVRDLVLEAVQERARGTGSKESSLPGMVLTLTRTLYLRQHHIMIILAVDLGKKAVILKHAKFVRLRAKRDASLARTASLAARNLAVCSRISVS